MGNGLGSHISEVKIGTRNGANIREVVGEVEVRGELRLELSSVVFVKVFFRGSCRLFSY